MNSSAINFSTLLVCKGALIAIGLLSCRRTRDMSDFYIGGRVSQFFWLPIWRFQPIVVSAVFTLIYLDWRWHPLADIADHELSHVTGLQASP